MGQPDLKTKLLTSYKAGDRSYEKIYLDGYDQSDVITGKGVSKREEFNRYHNHAGKQFTSI